MWFTGRTPINHAARLASVDGNEARIAVDGEVVGYAIDAGPYRIESFSEMEERAVKRARLRYHWLLRTIPAVSGAPHSPATDFVAHVVVFDIVRYSELSQRDAVRAVEDLRHALLRASEAAGIACWDNAVGLWYSPGGDGGAVVFDGARIRAAWSFAQALLAQTAGWVPIRLGIATGVAVVVGKNLPVGTGVLQADSLCGLAEPGTACVNRGFWEQLADYERRSWVAVSVAEKMDAIAITCADSAPVRVEITDESTRKSRHDITTSMNEIRAAWIPCSRFATGEANETSERLLATVIQSTLFAGAFLLPDSAYVNNVLLRRSMRDNETLRQLVKEGRLQVARRRAGESVAYLGEVCRKIDETGGRSPSFKREEFLNFSDLQFVDEHSSGLSYDVAAAAVQYSHDVLQLLHDEETGVQAKIENRIREAIADAAEERFRSTGSLGHSYFVSEEGLKADLERRLPGDDIWPRYSKVIRTLTKGPHVTCMANLFAVNPIFAPEHRDSIDLWRRRRIHELKIQQVTEFQCRTGLETFIHGLLALTSDDVLELAESDECQAYTTTVDALTVDNFDKIGFPRAFIDLRRRIEARILKRLDNTAHYAETGRLQIGVLEQPASDRCASALGVVADAAVPFGQALRTTWTVTTSRQDRARSSLARTPPWEIESVDKVDLEKAVSQLHAQEKGKSLGRITSKLSFRERGNMDMQVDLEDR